MLPVFAILWGCTTPSGPPSVPTGSTETTDTASVASTETFDSSDTSDSAVTEAAPRIVVLMIGDGMGRVQQDAASGYAYGALDALAMQALPHHGTVRTASPSGITDSAAAATAMATGAFTFNGQVGVDRDGVEAESLVELARSLGLGTAIVTTADLTHATPAAFTAHALSRELHEDIAAQQAAAPADVMLGGGAVYFDGLDVPGLITYASEHMDYDLERTDQPSLTEMSISALDSLLESHPQGFFVMIEGARIDMAGHANDLANSVGDTVAFDEAVGAVHAWLEPFDATLVVTADHETGGLAIHSEPAVGVMPDATWQWGLHTNADVDVYGSGPGTELLHEQVVDHRSVHAVLKAQLSDTDFVAPEPVLIPDGHLGDLAHHLSTQLHPTDFGEDHNELIELRVDADDYGLQVGIEGAFEWGRNTVVLLIDADHGAGTGSASMLGAVQDEEGYADGILGRLKLTEPADPGYGADFAVVASGGLDVWLSAVNDLAGLRGLDPLDDLPWLPSVLNYGDGSRDYDSPPVPGRGLEIALPWESLYGATPTEATLAVVAVLVNDDGSYTSNQALPPFDLAEGAGEAPVALPGVAVIRFEAGSIQP